MARNNTITLFDLQLASGCTISPFVWATKYALRHKGFDIDIVPGGFTGIMERTNGFSDRLPVIVDDGHWVKDSWLIAEYLDEKYPNRPKLIDGDSMKVLTKFIDGWLWRTAIRPWFRCYILDYHNLSLPQDHAYVRESREQLFLGGRKLEEVQAGREERLPMVPPDLEPFRELLKDTRWLGGEHPNYADYRALAVFLWTASVATIPPLHDDDPLKDYIDRGFDLFGGLGRHPALHTLFGLPKSEAQAAAAQ
ncbi:MAG: glutathione S-transferase family protein [Alphaproteobacteria bacterium]|nr:glutathione S-transferase family protein [Alphaproteobacteria bacterium]MDE2012818.1 glutathione S-transferase family protein [Alphaproteobacteria bacterium]MDE2074006.1 glutathione S-transferase family protein [Alphaproteobacteria bacterium]MDE2352414.1 glutathione S-transferase family protein [Alphaproteobacteria bacterium]